MQPVVYTMTRLWCMVAVLLLALSTILVVWINNTPADEDKLQALLQPTDCTSPCFIGIEPGITGIHDARMLLENHPWVMDIELVFHAPDAPMETRDGRLRWRWNGRQPDLLRAPFLDAGEVVIEHGVVQSVKVATSVSFGDAWLLLGVPTHGYIGTSRIYLERFDNHMAVYNERGVKIQTLVPHAPRIATFWNALVEVTFEAQPSERQMYRLPCWLRCE